MTMIDINVSAKEKHDKIIVIFYLSIMMSPNTWSEAPKDLTVMNGNVFYQFLLTGLLQNGESSV